MTLGESACRSTFMVRPGRFRLCEACYAGCAGSCRKSFIAITPRAFGAPLSRWIPSRPRVLCTRHGLVDSRPRQEFKFWISARLFCDTVIAVCDAGRQNMAAHRLSDPNKIVVIRNGATPAPGTVATKRASSGLVYQRRPAEPGKRP